MPILLACVLRCDAPHCINNHQDQTGYLDLQGGIYYQKKGLVWKRSGEKLACSEECEKQLVSQEPTGGGAPGNGDKP